MAEPQAPLPPTLLFLERWLPLLIGVGVLVIAALVNRFAREKRKRIKRVFILYVLYLLAFGAARGLDALHEDGWSKNFNLATGLLEAFTLVNLAALAFFDLALPAVKVKLVSITSDIIVGVAYIVSAFGALHDAGMDPTSLLTTSAVVGGVLTLSLQNTLGNIFGGVALQLDGLIHVGDWVQLESGKQGLVKEIRWRHTVVETRDWDTIIVPNASLLAHNITILGKRIGAPIQHRMTVPFHIDYRYPPSLVIDVVNEGLRAAPIHGVAADPAPLCFCYDLSKDGRESMGYYAARYWLVDIANDDAANSRIRTRVFSALRRAGIPLARPVSTTFFRADEDEGARTARYRAARIAAFKAVDLFRSLTDDELQFLASRLGYHPFTAGEIVTRQGSVAAWLYILTGGKVDVVTSVDGGPKKVVASIDAPGVFGEMGLMTGESRTADVVARTDIECYRLDKEAFEQILLQRPEIATAMAELLAQRKVALDATREGLDADARKAREAQEQRRILGRIRDFFGLGGLAS